MSHPPHWARKQLEQCQNGTYASPVQCAGNNWSTGNNNGNNSHWKEGDFVAFRLQMPKISAGTHTAIIQYDFTAPGGHQHSYDYLTSFYRTETTADPCSGFLATCPAPHLFPIPSNPVLLTCDSPQHAAGTGGIPQEPGNFALYNGTISSAAYVGTHECHASSVTATMAITFTIPANNTDAVLAWGALLAGEFDWGNGESAHAISGAPYHMRLISLDGSGGNQDRSLQSSAVYNTDLWTTVNTGGSGQLNIPVYDTATITGYQGPDPSLSPTLQGTLNFYLCVNNSGPSPWGPPDANGCDHQTPSILLNPTPIPVTGNGSYNSPTYTPTRNGYYCFRSEFTPATGSAYPFARETNTSLEGTSTRAECFLLQDPSSISLQSFAAASPDNQMRLAEGARQSCWYC